MNDPKRKPTRMSWYDYSSAGMYFITICAEEKQMMFGSIVGDGAFDVPQVVLTKIGTVLDQYIQSTDRIPNVHVVKYVIMPNHVHLLLAVDDSGVASGMLSPAEHKKNTATTRQNALIPHTVSTFKRLCNRKIGKNVFQRSYHDHVIRGKKDFEKIWAYIDDNPRRWKEDCFYTE